MWPSVLLPSYLLANLPAATSVVANTRLFISNIGVSGITLRSDGTRWRPEGGRAVLGVQTSDAAGTDDLVERIGYVAALPLALIQDDDILRFWFTGRRSDATDAMQFKVRFGTDAAGLTSTLLVTLQAASTSRTLSTMVDIKRESATSILQSGTAGVTGSYPMATSTTDWGTAVTVTDMDANQSYLSVTILKGADAGTTTGHVRGSLIEWITG